MISQTIEYALRAMIYLSSLEPGVTANSESIAARTKVPHGYLSKVLRDLVVAELVSSQRGPNGGFSLAKDASEISMLEIVNAVDGIQRIKRCPLGNPAHVELCPLHRRLDNAMAAIEKDFAATSLSEVLETSTKSAKQCQSLVAPTVRGKKA
jgi:Rrf2 family nitric oxide-sensitive transcriptional repressor